MLTVDLVRARRRNGELFLVGLTGQQRERARDLAAQLLELSAEHLGQSRASLREAWQGLSVSPRDRKLCDGLAKLIEDQCEFASESPIEPLELRRVVFVRAAEMRRSVPLGESYCADKVLEPIARDHGLSVGNLKQCLYSDLKSQQLLLKLAPLTAESLLARYQLAELQAVLLRSVKVTVKVLCPDAAALRRMFRVLKFRRLIFNAEALGNGYYLIRIDGPYSLFDAVTKYGLALALVLPNLLSCQKLELSADLRWGKGREPLCFRLAHEANSCEGADSAEPWVSTEIRELLRAFGELNSRWRVRIAETAFDVRGVGTIVPDLVFFHTEPKRQVYFELLGFWNRDAVFKRIELVERGLDAPFLFAANARLRVSEELLDGSENAALYVFKTTLNPRAILRKLEALDLSRTSSSAPRFQST